MKHYNSMRNERNADLLKICRQMVAAGSGESPTLIELADRLAKCKAPRYYVGYEYAHRIIHQIANGEKPRWKSPYIEAQWQSLFDDVMQIRQRTNCTISDALTMALVDLPAPSFFLSPYTIYRIIACNPIKDLYKHRKTL